ncbi:MULTISPECIES: DUF4307 domain-containing protein [unclassified Nocardiopsis]|uniref:DUF4307 domain-containing protein n=1 Tax=unclassified Nocardiopsis TaxID=2649073 RepID=UPI00066B3A36|nr:MULTISPECIES: DUF4307 domain-containing protein [unclassified Nocardiopsis]MBQ1083972.1 DUF4307 domain-containing protein [Nocardiopsis sp. B62]
MSATPEDDAVNSADTAPALRKRHGNGPVFFVVATIFAVAVSIGWGYSVMSYTGLSGGVYHQVVAVTAPTGSEARIDFEVNSKNGAECLLRALDSQMVEVGTERVEVEGGNRMVSQTVETVRQASTVEVASCREQGSQD